ncbi:MAG: ATP-binding cassette domain-containing protein, partial [Promethearchaeota archaeon]
MIKISNLSKSFGSFKAVENLNINIQEGEIFGLIGPNGSGKTTTILTLLDIL